MAYPTKKLGEVAEFINGYPFSPDDWESDGLPIIRIQNLNDPSKPYNYFQGELDDKYLVDDGDILISWSASLGVYLWSKGPAWLNQHIFKVRENPEIVNRMYFYFVAQTVLEEMKRKVHGGTMQHITKGPFERIKIPVPSLPTQQKIVERLNAVRKAQELNEKQISLTNELFQSLLHEELKSKDGWDSKKLGEIVEFLDHQRIPLSSEERAKRKGQYPYYGATGVLDWIDDYIFDGEFVLLAEDGGPFFEKDKPIAYRVSGRCWVNNHAHVLKPGGLVDVDFLGYSLMFMDVTAYLTGSTRAKLNKTQAKKIKTPLPPLKTQHQIVKKLSAVQDYKKKLLKQKELSQELFDSVLDKCMKGELVK